MYDAHPFVSELPAAPSRAMPPVGMAAPMLRRYGDVQHWREVASRATLAGDAELALRCWRHVRQLQPEAADALFHIGCCYARSGEPGRACLIFQALAGAAAAPPELRQRAARLALVVEPEADA